MTWDAERRERDRHQAARQREDAARARDDVRQSRLSARQLSDEDATRRARMRALLRQAEAQRDWLAAEPGAPGAAAGRWARTTTARHGWLPGGGPSPARDTPER